MNEGAPEPGVATIPWPARREPGEWRGDAAAIAVLSFDVDAESAILAEGDEYIDDLSTMSHQAYGPRVGVPRIVELLTRHDLRATFFVPGVTASRWPDTVRLIADAGHEVACHGHTHRRLVRMTPDDQREDLELAIEALDAVGVDPSGYRAPYWQLTEETLELLPRAGIAYDSSLMDDDRPYVIEARGASLAELPVHWSLDDWEQYGFLPEPDIGQQIELPAKAVELWTGELDAMRETGSLCVLTCHPFLSGRPSRIRAIERFIEFARERGDVEILSAEELAKRVVAA
jgi:peptidoglycan/xylan/chitin deacetylase (PgdA/CDA1 family)